MGDKEINRIMRMAFYALGWLDRVSNKPILNLVILLPVFVVLDLLRPVASLIPTAMGIWVEFHSDTYFYILTPVALVVYFYLFYVVFQAVALFRKFRLADTFGGLQGNRRNLVWLFCNYYLFNGLAYQFEPLRSILIDPYVFDVSWLASPVPDVLVAMLLLLALVLLGGDFNEAMAEASGDAIKQPEKSSVAVLEGGSTTISLLRARAKTARMLSAFAIMGIIILLSVSAVILVSTIQDTSLDAPVSKRARLEGERSKILDERLSLRGRLESSFPKGMESTKIFSGEAIHITSALDFARNNLPSNVEEGDLSLTRREFEASATRYAQMTVRLEGVSAQIADLPKRGTLLDERNQYLLVTLQSVLVRVGAVVLILFLVRLLFNLYRYLTRIAAAHDSQADAIELTRGDVEALPHVLSALSPERYDFGVAPKGPVDQAVDIIRAVQGGKS